LACQALGDLGADVVKVEPPAGDSNRHIGPAHTPGMGALFLTCNRNKRSIVLDLKRARAREAVLRLAGRADVVVHNLRPAAVERLGLGYEAFRAVNPRIVYCGTYGYSRRGPYRDLAAYDDSIQAASGLASLSARMGDPPRFVPTILADKTTAMAVVSAVLAALFHRERTGAGQEIEVPMFETMVGFTMSEHLFGHVFDPPEGPIGYTRLLTRERRPYPTKDGYLAVLPYLDEHWRAFCERAERPDLAADPRFVTLRARSQHIEDVYAETARVMATRTTAEWIACLEGSNVPLMTVNALEDLLDDPHLAATGFWQRVAHPTEGMLRMPAPAGYFSETPASIRRPPPRLGEHSLDVLRECGCDEPTIAALLADGALVQVP
jgi:crotonobetainyl-CoA:carnitine CoA-transferase CaiB-like acyl-CoA transferase